MNKDALQDIIRILKSYQDKILFAYLFGSLARGEATSASDLDIALYCAGDGPAAYFDMKLALYAALCRVLQRNDVDIVMLNTTKNLILLDEIVRNGVVIYDKNPQARMAFELKTLLRVLDFKSHRQAIMGV